MKKIRKFGLTIAILSIFVIGGEWVSAYSFDTFFGGVTGLPGRGTTWGEMTPSKRRVAVQAKGKTTKVVYANRRGRANATVSRAFSGNRSGWWWV